MKLYYMPGACSLATHILLAEVGAKYGLERVGRDKTTEHGEDFMAVNPKGYVPALRLDDGEIVTENVAIHSFIADSHPDSHLLPANGTRERLRANELIVFISTEIHKGYSPLFSPTLPDEAKAGYREKLATRYALIEKQLGDGRTWLTGETYTTADAYLFTVSTWAKPLNVDLSTFTRVQAWLGRVAARPAVKTAMTAEGLLAA
jgi:glutathione S-transferase